MPQMAPYNWFIMFMIFNMIMLLIIIYTYYMFMPPSNIFHPKKIFSPFKWMW